MPVSGIQVAQVVGITAAVFVAGSNATYTLAVVPVILRRQSDEPSDKKRMISQWRTAYNIGFRVVPLQYLLACVSFGYLSYTAKPSPLLRNLYAAAAVLVPSVLPFHTWVMMRPLLGALCLRAEKLAGPGEGTKAETLGKDQAGSIKLEESKTTEELVGLFGWYNGARVVTGVVGALVGIWASLEHARMLGAGSLVDKII